MQVPDATARQIFRDAKYGAGYEFFTHRLGHGVGLDQSEWPYLVQGNDQKMMAGMVFSNGPGIYVRDKFGLRLEDDMVVTDKGAELLLWQSPSLQDPFAIPAVLPQKNAKDTPAETPHDTKPADSQPHP
jgi:Xaa-Pro dipeptidase